MSTHEPFRERLVLMVFGDLHNIGHIPRNVHVMGQFL